MVYRAKKLMAKLKLLSKTPEEREKFLEIYKKLQDINENIDYSLQLDFFSCDSEIFEIASIDQLSRVLADTEDNIQDTFFGLMKLDKDFLKYICQQDAWDLALTKLNVLRTKNGLLQEEIDFSGEAALKTIPKDIIEEDKKTFYENLLKLCTQTNLGYVGEYSDVLNYVNIDRQSLIYILENSSDEKEKKDSLLKLKYGIGRDAALNLVKKYGKDIDYMRQPTDEEIEALGENNSKQMEVFSIAKMHGYDLEQIKSLSVEQIEELKSESDILKVLIDMKNINEAENIEEYIDEDILKPISNEKKIDFNSLNYELKLSQIFEKAYDNTLYKPDIKDIAKYKDSDEFVKSIYEGKKIDVYEAKYDKNLSMFLRVDGAYIDSPEPDNYQERLDISDISYHGNCKSYCTYNNFAIAKVDENNAVVFGYSKCQKNTLNMMAPWDIYSDDANLRMASKIANWDLGYGIQYEFPTNLNNNTRHSHNEFVSERLVWNYEEKKFEKDKPDFIFYEIDSEHDPRDPEQIEKMSKDKLWIRTQKAASQLGIPIVLLNKEKLLEKETEKIEELKQIFLGNEKDKFNRTKEEILEELIVRFENNRTSVESPNMHGKEYKEQYFTNKNRESLHNEIFDEIIRLTNRNDKEGTSLINKYINICQGELDKAYSSKGLNIDRKEFEIFYINKTEELSKYKTNESNEYIIEDLNEDLLTFMKRIREPIGGKILYQNKKAHSNEHIDKVMIFADKLAKMEGLNEEERNTLLLASMLHDCGRTNDKKDDNHGMRSAELIKKFDKETLKELNITEENLPLIQTIIFYHNYNEGMPIRGVDKEIISDTYMSFYEKLHKTQNTPIPPDSIYKMCMLIKDADALDRYRFSNRGAIDIRYLKSDAARSLKMRKYAKRINERYAEEMIKLNYGESIEDVQENEGFVKKLHDLRAKNENTKNEKQIDIEDLWINVYQEKSKISEDRTEIKNKDIPTNTQFFEQEIGKATVNIPTDQKDKMLAQIIKDEKELEEQKEGQNK